MSNNGNDKNEKIIDFGNGEGINRQDLNIIREELLYKIDATEYNNNDTINNFKDVVDKKIIDFELVISSLTMQVSEYQNANIFDKMKIDKLEDLIKFKESTNDILYNINSKLINLNNNYNDSCYKYDQIFLKNMEVPGIVGDYAKYKNLREFIEANVKEMNMFNNYKDKNNQELKKLKFDFDNVVKTIGEQKSNMEKNLREFCSQTVGVQQEKIKNQLLEFQNEINTIKIFNGKFHVEAMNNVKELNEKLLEYNADKIKLMSEFNESISTFKKGCEDYEKMKIEFLNAEKTHVTMNDALKDLKKKFLNLNSIVNNELMKIAKAELAAGIRTNKQREEDNNSNINGGNNVARFMSPIRKEKTPVNNQKGQNIFGANNLNKLLEVEKVRPQTNLGNKSNNNKNNYSNMDNLRTKFTEEEENIIARKKNSDLNPNNTNSRNLKNGGGINVNADLINERLLEKIKNQKLANNDKINSIKDTKEMKDMKDQNKYNIETKNTRERTMGDINQIKEQIRNSDQKGKNIGQGHINTNTQNYSNSPQRALITEDYSPNNRNKYSNQGQGDSRNNNMYSSNSVNGYNNNNQYNNHSNSKHYNESSSNNYKNEVAQYSKSNNISNLNNIHAQDNFINTVNKKKSSNNNQFNVNYNEGRVSGGSGGVYNHQSSNLNEESFEDFGNPVNPISPLKLNLNSFDMDSDEDIDKQFNDYNNNNQNNRNIHAPNNINKNTYSNNQQIKKLQPQQYFNNNSPTDYNNINRGQTPDNKYYRGNPGYAQRDREKISNLTTDSNYIPSNKKNIQTTKHELVNSDWLESPDNVRKRITTKRDLLNSDWLDSEPERPERFMKTEGNFNIFKPPQKNHQRYNSSNIDNIPLKYKHQIPNQIYQNPPRDYSSHNRGVTGMSGLTGFDQNVNNLIKAAPQQILSKLLNNPKLNPFNNTMRGLPGNFDPANQFRFPSSNKKDDSRKNISFKQAYRINKKY